MNAGFTVYMSLFDPEKVYGIVEFAVQLDRLFMIAVSGKNSTSSGTGTRMGDHPLLSQWKEGFIKAPSLHHSSLILLWTLLTPEYILWV